ncbi:MAG: DUF3078 domain-containing protein [Candidatus Zixiibacteriota bacterium]
MQRTQLRTVLILLVVFSTSLFAAEEKKNHRALDLGLNVTQSSYSDSWTGGEAGNVTWVINADGKFTHILSKVITLNSTAKLAFGQTLTQDKETKTWAKPTKSTDKIDLESVAMYDLKSYIEPYMALRFESQFLDASDEIKDRYINPITLTISAGVARQIIKNEKSDILSRFGFAFKEYFNKYSKMTITYSYPPDTSYADESKTTSDGGLESVTDYKFVLSDKMAYEGKISLFKAFFYSEKDEVKGTLAEDDWKAIDLNWENKISASITKYVQVSFYVQLLYDKQISYKGRLKETLALGLTYKMF